MFRVDCSMAKWMQGNQLGGYCSNPGEMVRSGCIGYIMKEEVARFAKYLVVWWKRKRGVKADFRVLA